MTDHDVHGCGRAGSAIGVLCAFLNSRTLLAVVVLVASPFIAQAQKQFRPATCEVKPLWVGKQVRSSNFGLMGQFQTDGTETYIKRSFRLGDKNVIATVAIDFVYEYSTKPERDRGSDGGWKKLDLPTRQVWGLLI